MRKRASPATSGRNRPCRHLDFSPWDRIRPLTSRTVRSEGISGHGEVWMAPGNLGLSQETQC